MGLTHAPLKGGLTSNTYQSDSSIDHQLDATDSTLASLVQEVHRSQAHRKARLDKLKAMPLVVLDSTLPSIAEHIGGYSDNMRATFDKILSEVQAAAPHHAPLVLCSFAPGASEGLEPFVAARAQAQTLPANAAAELDVGGPPPSLTIASALLSSSSSSGAAAGAPQLQLPQGLLQCRQYGIRHVVLNVNLESLATREAADQVAQHLRRLAAWVATNLGGRAYIHVPHLSALVSSLTSDPARMAAAMHMVQRLGVGSAAASRAMPEARPYALVLSDTRGTVLPRHFAAAAQAVKQAMTAGGWGSSALLVNSRRGYGMSQAAVLEALTSGADGVYSSVGNEASGTGQAGYLVTATNLARVGNPHITQAQLATLHRAARAVVVLATGALPHARTEVYGDLSSDICFDPTWSQHPEPTAGDLVGLAPRTRISQLATPQMVAARLAELFGPHPQGSYALDTATCMVRLLHEDMLAGVKHDYNQAPHAASLWVRAGGAPSPAMLVVLSQAPAAAAPGLSQLASLLDVELAVGWGGDPDVEVVGAPVPFLAGPHQHQLLLWDQATGAVAASSSATTAVAQGTDQAAVAAGAGADEACCCCCRGSCCSDSVAFIVPVVTPAIACTV